MNIYIMTDMEGISGITSREQVLPEASRYQEGRRLMTADINVVVRACKEAGAEKVYVRDCHGGGMNIIWSDLCAEADGYVIGYTGDDRYPGLDECDAVILLGYHAMAGTLGGTLEHSMSSASIQNYHINGIPAGEVAIDAGIVGDKGKPVIMVTGDDKVCREAKELLPWVVTAEVKRGITWRGGMLLPAEKAYALLRERTIEAVQNAAFARPLVWDKPITMRVELVERGILPSAYAKPYMRILDGRTYEVTGDTMEEVLFRA
ncbi:MAG: M55 family metallopeptidase [Clostridia bacterium]|nr:M55 family metallopeptidase [Clostridia bacterium]